MDLEQAEKVIGACRKKSQEMGVVMCIAVMDKYGYLTAFARSGDTTLDSIEISQNKAYTASMLRIDTRSLGEQCQPGQPLYGIQNNLNGRLVIFPGGIPIFKKDKLLGAVGASGGSVEEDEAVAQEGVDALTDPGQFDLIR
jgi:uncharacterized protein GlcG (DUF336 family)